MIHTLVSNDAMIALDMYISKFKLSSGGSWLLRFDWREYLTSIFWDERIMPSDRAAKFYPYSKSIGIALVNHAYCTEDWIKHCTRDIIIAMYHAYRYKQSRLKYLYLLVTGRLYQIDKRICELMDYAHVQ